MIEDVEKHRLLLNRLNGVPSKEVEVTSVVAKIRDDINSMAKIYEAFLVDAASVEQQFTAIQACNASTDAGAATKRQDHFLSKGPGVFSSLIKGFDVLHQACASLWQRRQDFELVATGDPPGRVDPFTQFVGWLSQEELPGHLRAADMVVLPTIAQEALGRTAVEAMAVGRPVVASRLGGLPFTVAEGATGLLCEPGDPDDLARKIEMLLDDPGLRERLGLAGRRRFEEHYSWDVIIERHYNPLLAIAKQ